MRKFKELEKIVKRHFSDAVWDKKQQRWTAKTKPNSKDRWEQPETLVAFDNDASKKFYSYMSGNSWDDEGNISIGVRKNIFENNMRYIPTFEQFVTELKSGLVTESTINRFNPEVKTINKRVFSRLMPKTSKTIDDATKHIMTFKGETMFVHYQQFTVRLHGNKPDRPTYRISNEQYWLNDTQLTWQGRKGEKVNVTLLIITDITDPDNEVRLGSTYVDTQVYLDEQPRVFEIIKRIS